MNAVEVMAAIKASRKPHYVYILTQPDGRPFYVGIGTRRRILDHEIFAKRQNVDGHKVRVIRKIWRDGRTVDYSIHGWFDDRQSAEAAETALILKIGRRDIRTGSLANVTNGGEGASNPSEAALQRKSQRLKATWATRDRTTSLAHLNDPEVRARAAASRLGKKRGPYNWTKSSGPGPEARKRSSERLKADPVSRRPGIGAKISKALKARAERLRLISEQLKS